MKDDINGVLLGLSLTVVTIRGYFTVQEEFKKMDRFRERDNRLEQRAFVNPDDLKINVEGMQYPKTIATYNGTNYLFKTGINGVPYFEKFEAGGRE